MQELSDIEKSRQDLQISLDGEKTQEERNVKGQFSTPFQLATDILNHAGTLLPKTKKVRFMDPAFGTGSFYSAFLHTFPHKRIAAATGYEIDPHYGEPAKQLWEDYGLILNLKDFTKIPCPEEDSDKYNLIICNPPYVRHHHIINGEKARLKQLAFDASGVSLSGLAGLYCYFLALSHCWLSKNGIAGWLIPSEFMDVNYGAAIKDYLLSTVTLLQIHRFEPNDVQFNDALVSSAVVWFKNKSAPKNHKVKFTFGGSIDQPHYEKLVSATVLKKEPKWTRFPLSEERAESDYPVLGDYFTVKRGIATGDNSFFIMTPNEIQKRNLPFSQFRPILPSPRYLPDTEIHADKNGNPTIEKPLFVLDCKLAPDVVKKKYPELWEYLQEGIEKGVANRYLCKHRKLWYSQENRPTSNFYCTYIGRSDTEGKKPFRFILNHSKAIVANAYLVLYPKPFFAKKLSTNPALFKKVLNALNNIASEAMLDEGRVYGGGLHKLEPRELSKVPAGDMWQLLEVEPDTPQHDFFNESRATALAS